ncbi:MAG: hypothetical protein A3C93_01385 [Candidatus Lloydbacteria bacterium RIFCSPHIGHO2_02_FULL_54_17]|uniref:Uncharacterized protein n=1 Tax=Candidatus Lloydbacteria bacterium RIFCSPHIGHO2_02_FULL_54_17 TaxID=1798664 RepID=A0A1G2DBI6_9BACT|nr:MAG: hypothetical protein A2762_04650 [Candidatus Lloydbacteria bacterium RIFCSPHIGHO2_01_FULL_54_11]OGZ10985.1 MAG: hypothetical protein A3C93_01385 [Candidatus Lloydbacteria bacterium RIFCSPHIGHO2_02_FULL_54_17]OGZ13136.1 MAG: hypothetical protein A2948_02080 [Candidatus Lloydbacteria bacterium RIFCSPLOWO2_01_FULL_54_18]
MVKPQVCRGEALIRALLECEVAELVWEKQEVRVRRKEFGDDFTGSVESYIPKGSPEHDEEDCDALYIETEDDMGYVFQVPEIAELEILPTCRMTPEKANRQMDEMERAAGLRSK